MSSPESAWFAPTRDTAVGTSVSNPFDSEPVAQRYARGRPYYHHAALRLARKQLGIDRVGVALDIGCGTGLSTRAVGDLADHVVAIDVSPAMLRAAEQHPRSRYVAARAEQIPLRDASADLATIAAAFHWFDQRRVLAELARVLRASAGLVVYSDFFHGRLVGRPAFAEWLKDSYLPRYRTPARHAYFDPDAAVAAGFDNVAYGEDEIQVPLTHNQLADYLVSQSNAAIAIESELISAQALHRAIVDEVAPFFPDNDRAHVVFGVRVWTCSRSA